MVLRSVAAALVEIEKSLRKIVGYKERWMLTAVLDEETISRQQEKVA